MAVRREAAKALGKIGDTRAVEPLIQALRDEDWEVRSGAARALGEIGDARAVEPLIQTLFKEKDFNPALDVRDFVREEVALALGKIGDARAIEPLIHLLNHKDSNVRKAAKEALEKIKAEKIIKNINTHNAKAVYCSKCGNELEDDAVFCPKCGTKIKEVRR